MGAVDLEPLRAVEITDKEIHDATHVVAYFNYINRVADALGVDLEPEMSERPEGWGGLLARRPSGRTEPSKHEPR